MQCFYPAFLALCWLLVALCIPRKHLQQYALYGLLLGGLGDVIAVLVFQNLLHVMWFKNQGIFNVFNLNALSPPAWVGAMVLFLHCLPLRKIHRYIYIAIWAMASVAYGYVVRNVGLFDFKSWFYPIPSYLIFFTWWLVSSWVYLRTRPIPVVSDVNE